MTEVKTIKTFKEKYSTDEEFKKRHLAYVKEKIECECGKMIARSNMVTHKKSHLHINRCKVKEAENMKEKEVEDETDLEEMKKLVKELYNKIESLKIKL